MSSSPSVKSQKSLSNSTKGNQKNNKLFITSINPTIPLNELETKLRDIIGKFGTVTSLQCKKNFNQGYSFAFAEFKDVETANTILNQLNGYNFEGRKLKVQPQKSNPREKNYTPLPYRNNNYYNNNNNRQRQKERQKSPQNRRNSPQKKERRRSKTPERKQKRYKRDNSIDRHRQKRGYRERSQSRQIENYRNKREENLKEKTYDKTMSLNTRNCFNCGSPNHIVKNCQEKDQRITKVQERKKSRSRSNDSRIDRKERRKSATRSRDQKKRRHERSSSESSSDSNRRYKRRERDQKKRNNKYHHRRSNSNRSSNSQYQRYRK